MSYLSRFSITLGGTLSAQLVSLLGVLVTSRFYDIDSFGEYSIYVAVSLVLSQILSCRCEAALFVKGFEYSASVVISASIALSTCCALLLMFFYSLGFFYFSWSAIGLWMIVSGYLANFMYLAISYFLFDSDYALVSIVRFMLAISSAVLQVGFGFLSVENGLVYGAVLANTLIFVACLFYLYRKNFLFGFSLSVFRKCFPYSKYELPARIFSVAAHNSQSFFMPIIFGHISAGYYFMMLRTMGQPAVTFGASLGEVMREYFYRLHGRADVISKLTYITFGLAALGGVFFVPVYFWGEELFIFILGEKWGEAGVYAEVISLALLVRFIASPLSTALQIAGWSRLNLLGQFFVFLSVIISFFLFDEALDAIKALSVIWVGCYIYYIIISWFALISLRS